MIRVGEQRLFEIPEGFFAAALGKCNPTASIIRFCIPRFKYYGALKCCPRLQPPLLLKQRLAQEQRNLHLVWKGLSSPAQHRLSIAPCLQRVENLGVREDGSPRWLLPCLGER